MNAVINASRPRKNSSPAERSNSADRERPNGKLSATLQWLANNPVVRLDEQIELILVTWHPLIIEDTYCDDDIAAQRVLDATIRKCSPKSTMVCGGHRVWWLLNSGQLSLKLKNLKCKIERAVLKQSTANPLLEMLEDSLIVQRIGCWNGPTTTTAKGLAGIFADMAAGQTLLDNFGLPFERQHTSSPRKKATVKNQEAAKSKTQRPPIPSQKSNRSQPSGSSWITTTSISTLGQFQASPSHQAPLLQLA